MKRRLLLAAGACVATCASPQGLGLPPAPSAPLRQQPGVALPLDLGLIDSDGRPLRLGDLFDGERSVLLVLGYYRCPQLCGLVMHSLLEALQRGDADRGSFRIVRVSIDPADTPQTARAQRALDLAYADFLQGADASQQRLDLKLLTGRAGETHALAQRVGFDYRTLAPAEDDRVTQPARFAHPAAVVVVTPKGRISRYLPGLGYDPGELRVALAEAAHGRIGAISERLALLCAHYDPHVGRYSTDVMAGFRVLGVAGAVALAAWCWRRRGPGSQP